MHRNSFIQSEYSCLTESLPFITLGDINLGESIDYEEENFGGWNHQTSRDAIQTMHLFKARLLKVRECGMSKNGTLE